jgi:hypothetical protein
LIIGSVRIAGVFFPPNGRQRRLASFAIIGRAQKRILRHGKRTGTLHIPQANRDLRIENKISKDDKGNLKVVDYSIDQGGQPLVANKASFDGGVLTYSIDRIGGKYEGKMSPDGKNALVLISGRGQSKTRS